MYVNNIQQGLQLSEINRLIGSLALLSESPKRAIASPEASLAMLAEVSLLPPTVDYSLGGVPTPPEAGELFTQGLANALNPAWREQVELAAKRNGGFGNDQEGYLAWGKDGFFRFKNDTIPPELSRRYAEISLKSGIQIEKLKITNKYTERHIPGKTEFAEKFETRFDAFVQDPSKGFSVNGGGRLYKAYVDPESGATAFYTYKKASGFSSFLGKIGKFFKPLGKLVSFFSPAIGLALQGLTLISERFGSTNGLQEVNALLSAVGQKK